MDKIVIINNGDGTVGILNPSAEMFDIDSRTRQLVPELDGLSDDEILQWIINKDVPQDKSYRITTLDKLPSDRFFRNAWTDDNPTETVDIDYDRAVEIKKSQLRELRKPLLCSLDTAYMRADEAQNSQLKKDIAQQKQLLRDVTSLELPTDINELKEFIPDVLKGE